MILTTFDKELYENGLKEDAFNEGKKELLMEQIQKKLKKGKSIETIADELEETIDNIKELISQIS